MSLTLTPSPAPFPNPYANMSIANVEAAREAIDALQYADLFRTQVSKVRQDAARTMRVDIQGDIVGPPLMKNIQVQVNGVNGSSTVAVAIISTSTETADPVNRQGVLNMAKKALNKSLDTKLQYTLTGAIDASNTDAQRQDRNQARNARFDRKHPGVRAADRARNP